MKNINNAIDTNKIYASTNFGDFKIIKYISWDEIHVEFLLTGYKLITVSSSIKSGSVKDKLHPSVCGVGFIGVGKYKRNDSKAYHIWKGMLARCYSHKKQKRQPTYIGVTVCKEWHNFQNFAKWFYDNYIEGFDLDKDIKQIEVENKTYSPDACEFVSRSKNNTQAHAKNWHMVDPNGERHEIYNMSEFCRDRDLHHGDMRNVCRGKLKQAKGWTKA